MAPVWEAAALAPAALLPDFMITMGFLAVTSLAILEEFPAIRNIFQINEDDFCFFVMEQIVEYVRFGDIAFVAEAYKFANPHLATS